MLFGLFKDWLLSTVLGFFAQHGTEMDAIAMDGNFPRDGDDDYTIGVCKKIHF